MIVLDTNVVSEMGKPKPEPKILDWLKRQHLPDVYLCGPVIMELSFGAENFLRRTGSDRYMKALHINVDGRFKGRIISFDGDTPQVAGKVRAAREGIGRPINVQDAMIAAICLVHSATLATRNTRDFEGLDLKLVNPFEPAP